MDIVGTLDHPLTCTWLSGSPEQPWRGKEKCGDTDDTWLAAPRRAFPDTESRLLRPCTAPHNQLRPGFAVGSGEPWGPMWHASRRVLMTRF